VTRHFRFSALVLVLALPYVGIAAAQESDYPLMEKIADKVVQKYRTTSCQDLAAQKSHPSTGKQAQMEKRAVEVLHQDPKLRAEFLKRVAAPIADKMFQCVMIP
jgi:hypothetical protein